MKIAYLNPDECTNIHQYQKSFNKKMLKHPKTVIYTLETFVEAFNNELISDLGYIVLVEEDK